MHLATAYVIATKYEISNKFLHNTCFSHLFHKMNNAEKT